MCIQRHYPRLIRLCYVRKDAVHHSDENTVSQRVPRVFDDGDDVRAMCGHVDKISPASMREFDCVDGTSRADNIGDVRYRGTGCGA